MRPGRVLCSACGFTNEPNARFCGGCGRPLARWAQGVDRPLLLAALHTPPHLAERILASRGAIQGERKLVTVMFADVLGSLELIAGRGPEQAQAILDGFLRTMISAVHRYEGTVNQVLGDGIMAIFGAPIAHEDHAVRAACAALAIQDAVRTAPGSDWGEHSAHPQVRIGLNSGVVVITAIHNDLSLDYRAVGATTHVASRMEQIAPPGTIRLTRETMRLAEGLVEAEPLGQITVKGFAEPVEVYELRRMTPGGTRFRARLARGLTPLFGRTEEMAVVADALRRSAAGESPSVAIYGEPGVGKSRFCYEVTRTDAARGCFVLETSAVSYERDTPYAAIVTLLRQYFGIAETETADELRRRLQLSLSELSPALLEYLPILLGVLDVPGKNELWQNLDPAPRKHRVFETVRALLGRLCEKQPVILIWEDLHWSDAESLEFLEGLLGEQPVPSLFVLLTGREELPVRDGTQPRQLLPLPPPLTDALLCNLLGAGSELAGLRALLIERTYGNPFFIEETVRSLIESGVLVGSPGRYELREATHSIDIPPTAEALIAARIDGLPPEVKALVQTAAVVGNEMSVDLLRSVSGLEEGVLRERLNGAKDSGVMYEIQLFPSPLCGFRHALTHDVAYGSVLQAQRASLHARVVEVIEDIYRDRLAEHVERLAEHTYRGGMWEKCVRYHIMAASRAASRFANHEAVRIVDRGLQVLEQLAPGQARSEAAIDLRLAGLAALLPLGEHERILRMLFEGEEIAGAIGDLRRLATVRSQISLTLWLAGQHERARESAERALVMAEQHQQFGLRLSARAGLVQAHHALGDLDRCRTLALELVKDVSGELERKRMGWAVYPGVWCRTFLGSALTLIGDFDGALRHLELGVELADATRHPMSRALIRNELGTCHLMQGNPEQALRTFEEAMAIATQDEVRVMYAPVAGWLGATLAELGRIDEAIEWLEKAVATGALRLCGHYGRFYVLNGLSIAYLRAGRRDEALARAEEAVDRTLACQEYVHHGIALLRLAAVQAERGVSFVDEAEGLYRKALERATSHGMRPLAAETHEGLGRLNARRGRMAAAQGDLRTAAKIYADIGLERQARTAAESAERVSAGARAQFDR